MEIAIDVLMAMIRLGIISLLAVLIGLMACNIWDGRRRRRKR